MVSVDQGGSMRAVQAEARLRSDAYLLSAALGVVREDGLHVLEHAGSAGPN